MSSISTQPVVGNVGLGQQHVHVARHAAGHRVDGELHVDAAPRQVVEQFADLVLRLRHRQAVSRHDDHAAGGFQNRRRLFGAGAALRRAARVLRALTSESVRTRRTARW